MSSRSDLCVSAALRQIHSLDPTLVILPSEVRPLALALFLVPLPRLPPLLFGAESPLLVAADPPVCMQPFQHELRRRRPHRIRLIRAQAQILHLLHQSLDAAEL